MSWENHFLPAVFLGSWLDVSYYSSSVFFYCFSPFFAMIFFSMLMRSPTFLSTYYLLALASCAMSTRSPLTDFCSGVWAFRFSTPSYTESPAFFISNLAFRSICPPVVNLFSTTSILSSILMLAFFMVLSLNQSMGYM
jgi:hypothetical protein